MVAVRDIEAAFPGAPDAAALVVSGTHLKKADLAELGARARTITGGKGEIEVHVARDRRTALVTVPLPDRDNAATIAALRDQLPANVLVTGDAASTLDFTERLNDTTPLVIAFVLGLALVLLLARSTRQRLVGLAVLVPLAALGAVGYLATGVATG
jgi:RND superfamily putative drug exporter